MVQITEAMRRQAAKALDEYYLAQGGWTEEQIKDAKKYAPSPDMTIVANVALEAALSPEGTSIVLRSEKPAAPVSRGYVIAVAAAVLMILGGLGIIISLLLAEAQRGGGL